MNNLIFNYAPWIMTHYPYDNMLVQPWVKGYKLNTYVQQQWRYLDIERPALAQPRAARRHPQSPSARPGAAASSACV